MNFVTHRSALLLPWLILACGGSAERDEAKAPSPYLYVWAGTGHDNTTGVDMIAVLDANPSSESYGAVLTALTVDSGGRSPAYTESVAPATGMLFVNDDRADKAYLVDFSDPIFPRRGGRLAKVPGGRRLHAFARLANGHVVATVQFGDSMVSGSPGGLAEFDALGNFVRQGWSRDSTFPGAKIRPSGLAVLPDIDRVVSASSSLDDERSADVVQVWRLSDLTLLKTLAIPEVRGDSAHVRPFAVSVVSDTSVLISSYNCGVYRVTGVAAEPGIERVLALPRPPNTGCAAPVAIGPFMILPVANAHRYAILDIAEPAHATEAGSFVTEETFLPHWISVDSGTDRLVVTGQSAGLPIVRIARFDSATGRLTWDERFRDTSAVLPGVSFDRPTWPNGVAGRAKPFGAVFVR